MSYTIKQLDNNRYEITDLIYSLDTVKKDTSVAVLCIIDDTEAMVQLQYTPPEAKKSQKTTVILFEGQFVSQSQKQYFKNLTSDIEELKWYVIKAIRYHTNNLKFRKSND